MRRRTVEGATTTDYILDGQSVVRTLVNNVVDRTYLHGARGPEYERIGANDPVWYLYDGLGSVLGTVDKNGTVVSTRKYDVYGAVRGSTGPGGFRHKFVGNLGHALRRVRGEHQSLLPELRITTLGVLVGNIGDRVSAFVNEYCKIHYLGNYLMNSLNSEGSAKQRNARAFFLLYTLFAILAGAGIIGVLIRCITGLDPERDSLWGLPPLVVATLCLLPLVAGIGVFIRLVAAKYHVFQSITMGTGTEQSRNQ